PARCIAEWDEPKATPCVSVRPLTVTGGWGSETGAPSRRHHDERRTPIYRRSRRRVTPVATGNDPPAHQPCRPRRIARFRRVGPFGESRAGRPARTAPRPERMGASIAATAEALRTGGGSIVLTEGLPGELILTAIGCRCSSRHPCFTASVT